MELTCGKIGRTFLRQSRLAKNLCEASFESLRLLTFDIVATGSLSYHGEAVSRISCRLLLWSSVSFPHGV